MDISGVAQSSRPIKKQNFGKISGDEPLEVKKLKLKKATQEFESYFLLHMLKAMRKTVPDSGLLDGGLGKDVYNGMMDEEMARKLASGSAGSLADMLYKSMLPQLEATAAAQNGENTDSKLNTDISSIHRLPINRESLKSQDIQSNAKSAVVENKKYSLPSAAVKPVIHSDPILEKFGKIINKAAEKYDVNPQLIYSVIEAESGGDPGAISDRGAKGLMQLMDTTAADMGVSDSLDIHQNIMGGTKYLRKMIDTFDGDMKKALAAYNAGPGIVSKYNGVPPYPETRQYVEKILGKLVGTKK